MCDKHTMRVLGQYLSNSSFCHLYIQKPFFYLLPSATTVKHKLLRQNKQFLTSISIYLVSTAASARSPLLSTSIRIRVIQIRLYSSIYRAKVYLLCFISNENEITSQQLNVSIHTVCRYTLHACSNGLDRIS